MITWNDLNLKQLLKCYWAISIECVTIHDRRLVIAQEVSGIPLSTFTNIEDSDERGEALLKWLAEYADPLFIISEDENGNKSYEPRLGLTKCPYPTLARKKKRKQVHNLYAAPDGLERVTIYELGYIFTFLEAFTSSGQAPHLNSLLATVYRPSRPLTQEEVAAYWYGDRRRSLYKEETAIKTRAEQFATVADPVKMLMYFWLLSCRDSIIREFPIIFSTGDGDDEKPAKDYGWAGLLLSIADGVKDLEEVANHSWRTVFIYLAKMEDERRAALLKSVTK